MLRAGIVGLPNVGKSTLFNALTSQQSALAANYPFATIEPNIGVVPVPDERLADEWVAHLERRAKPGAVVRHWDVESGRCLHRLEGHTDRVHTLAWSPDGQTLATASADGTAREWDVRSGRELLALRGHRGAVISVAWSPDGKRIATGSEDSTTAKSN